MEGGASVPNGAHDECHQLLVRVYLAHTVRIALHTGGLGQLALSVTSEPCHDIALELIHDDAVHANQP